MSQSEESNHTTALDASTNADLEQALKDLIALGRVWASYGLNVGKQALQTAARSQETAAKLLGELAAQLSDERQRNAR
jgi:hypothetical protein